jgi:ABC-type nitrate/sulfonate/bicarbonate transport system substrate-binding protein
VFVALEKKLAAEPAKFQALIRALAKANRFMYANKARTVEIAVKHAKLPRDVAEPAYDELVKGKFGRRMTDCLRRRWSTQSNEW